MPYRCGGEVPVLPGERVSLRPLTPVDAEPMFECWSEPEVRLFSDLPDMPDPGAAGEMIRILNGLSLTEDGLRWGIETHTGVLVGSCGLNWWQLEGAYRGEIGCELGRAYWGKGYMREAAALMIGYAFRIMGLNRLEALTDPCNLRAGRLFQSLGFTLEGRLKQYRHTDRGFVDANMHALLRKEWENMHGGKR